MSRRRGLTFVELLVASTMLAVLIVGLTGHLRAGAIVWQRSTSTGEEQQQQRVAMARMERDLSNALVYAAEGAYGSQPGNAPAPEFGQSALKFYSLEAVPREEKPATVRYITYACGEVHGVQALWRTSQSVGEARFQHAAKPVAVLPGCESLTFQYAYLGATAGSIAWNAEWKSPQKGLPRLMAVTLTMPQRTTVRYVHHPGGVFTSFTDEAPAP
jgi:hypothetical protein